MRTLMLFPLSGLVLAAILSGCAASPEAPRTQPAVWAGQSVPAADGRWWHARFGFHRDEGAAPDWHLDALVADRIVRPVLERHGADIHLWRFHRRAARDAAGHQFSFIFHAAPDAAARIYEDLLQAKLTAALLDSGRLRELSMDRRAAGDAALIESTSDPVWPAALQRAWPRYIMGASAAWLSLIRDLSERSKIASEGIDDLLAHYRAVNQAAGELWYAEGQHAFLHHLNALFGYEPLLIRTPMRY
jgi:hypothetical protein